MNDALSLDAAHDKSTPAKKYFGAMEEQHPPSRRQRPWSSLPYCTRAETASATVRECAAEHLLPVTERFCFSNRVSSLGRACIWRDRGNGLICFRSRACGVIAGPGRSRNGEEAWPVVQLLRRPARSISWIVGNARRYSHGCDMVFIADTVMTIWPRLRFF